MFSTDQFSIPLEAKGPDTVVDRNGREKPRTAWHLPRGPASLGRGRLGLGAQGLYWGLVMSAASAWHVPDSRLAEGRGCPAGSTGRSGTGSPLTRQVPRHQPKASTARPSKESGQACCPAHRTLTAGTGCSNPDSDIVCLPVRPLPGPGSLRA